MTVRESLPNTGETADTRRIYQASMLAPGPAKNTGRGGVIPEGGPIAGLLIHQTGTASANVLVEAGTAHVPMTATSGLNGNAVFINDSQLVQRYLQDFPADSQPRVDLLVARAQDANGGDGSNLNTIAIVKGTPGSSTTPPIPTSWNAIPLYTCALPANATTITDAMLTRVAKPTVAIGGIVPVGQTADLPPQSESYRGQYADHPTYGLCRNDGSAWNQIGGNVLVSATLDTTVECGNPKGVLFSRGVPMFAGRYYTVELYAHGTQITTPATIVWASLDLDGPATALGELYAFYEVNVPQGAAVIGTGVRTFQATETGTGYFGAVALSNSSKVRFLVGSVTLTVKDAGVAPA